MPHHPYMQIQENFPKTLNLDPHHTISQLVYPQGLLGEANNSKKLMCQASRQLTFGLHADSLTMNMLGSIP